MFPFTSMINKSKWRFFKEPRISIAINLQVLPVLCSLLIHVEANTIYLKTVMFDIITIITFLPSPNKPPRYCENVSHHPSQWEANHPQIDSLLSTRNSQLSSLYVISVHATWAKWREFGLEKNLTFHLCYSFTFIITNTHTYSHIHTHVHTDTHVYSLIKCNHKLNINIVWWNTKSSMTHFS